MPTPKPTENLPDWFVTDSAKRVEPDGSKKLSGWNANEPLPAQNFNWLLYSQSLWLQFLRGAAQFDAVIGSAAYATHATLAAALADATVTTNSNILILESIAVASTVTLNKAGWRIYGRPGVIISKSGVVTGFQIDAARVELHGLKFSGFSTGGDIAVKFTANGDYGRVVNCNFLNCDTEVDDSLVTAGKLPAQIGNLTEV